MNFDELIRYKSLTKKAQLSGQLFEENDLYQMPSRNICAHIDVDLFGDVEGITSLLGISKRQFVEMALLEAVKKAQSVMDEVNIYNYQEGDV